MSEHTAEKDAPCTHQRTRWFRQIDGGSHNKCLDCGQVIASVTPPGEGES
jgi:hypothetical protein